MRFVSPFPNELRSREIPQGISRGLGPVDIQLSSARLVHFPPQDPEFSSNRSTIPQKIPHPEKKNALRLARKAECPQALVRFFQLSSWSDAWASCLVCLAAFRSRRFCSSSRSSRTLSGRSCSNCRRHASASFSSRVKWGPSSSGACRRSAHW